MHIGMPVQVNQADGVHHASCFNIHVVKLNPCLSVGVGVSFVCLPRDPAHVAALEVACLRCLKEVVTLCRKNKVVPAQLSDIQAVMLDNLRASRGGTGERSTRGKTGSQPVSLLAPVCVMGH